MDVDVLVCLGNVVLDVRHVQITSLASLVLIRGLGKYNSTQIVNYKI